MQNPVAQTRAQNENDHWETLSLMIMSDVAPAFEIASRFVLLSICCGSLFFWLDLTTPLIWLVVYALSECLNIGYLRSRKSPGSRQEVNVATAINYLTTVCFAFFPVYLWQQERVVLEVASVALVASMALYGVSRYSGLARIAIWDGIVVSSLLMYFGFDLVRYSDDTPTIFLILTFTTLTAIYFCITLRENLQTRRLLKEAEKRNMQAMKLEAIGKLTGGIAHDFNNLLTVMIGNLDLYQVVDDPKEKDMFADEARNAAIRAATLTSHLLAFSRKAQLNPSRIDLSAFLNHFFGIVRRLLPESIRLELSVSGPQDPILVDEAQLEAALLNLVINARDAMEESGDLSLAFVQHDLTHEAEICGAMLPPGRYARIIVRDSGPGIPADQLAAVTEPFFTTKPTGKGSGLGLSMAKGFAEQSGGALQIVSTPQQGTVISIWLPHGQEKEADT